MIEHCAGVSWQSMATSSFRGSTPSGHIARSVALHADKKHTPSATHHLDRFIRHLLVKHRD